MWIDTWGNIQRESPWVAPSWQFELVLWDISFGFPLANHYNLPGSQSIFGISQDPSTCAHGSLSQEGSFQRGVLLEHPLTLLPLLPARSLFCACVIGEVSWLWIEKYVSEQGPASFCNCPAILVLEFWSVENESPIALLWGQCGGHLPSASKTLG